MDKCRDEWSEAFLAAGHTFMLNEFGEPDFWVNAVGFHNGPKCSTCGWSCCVHCTPTENIPRCNGPKGR